MYVVRSEEFLNSIERQIRLRGTLTIKQKNNESNKKV